MKSCFQNNVRTALNVDTETGASTDVELKHKHTSKNTSQTPSTRTCTQPCTHSHTATHTHSHTRTHSHRHRATHAHSHTHTHSHNHRHTVTLTQSQTHSHTHTTHRNNINNYAYETYMDKIYLSLRMGNSLLKTDTYKMGISQENYCKNCLGDSKETISHFIFNPQSVDNFQFCPSSTSTLSQLNGNKTFSHFLPRVSNFFSKVPRAKVGNNYVFAIQLEKKLKKCFREKFSLC